MAWLILLFWFAIIYSTICRINDKIKESKQKRLNKKHGQVINLNDLADGKKDIKEQKNVYMCGNCWWRVEEEDKYCSHCWSSFVDKKEKENSEYHYVWVQFESIYHPNTFYWKTYTYKTKSNFSYHQIIYVPTENWTKKARVVNERLDPRSISYNLNNIRIIPNDDNENINRWYKNNLKKDRTSRENRYYVNSVRDDILREERELYRD